MFKSLAIGALAAGLVAAAAFSAPSAIAARFGGVGGGVPHVSAPHTSPGVGAMHAPRARLLIPEPARASSAGKADRATAAYGYYGGCEWLRARTEETGRRYWWRRYEDCVDG